ncbi:MAG: MFS transporter [Gammaproteobacteria bacterium]
MKYPDINGNRMAVWAIVYYFCLMCSYFIIKPIRDEMAIASGVQNLQYLYTGTFVVMILLVPVFGWIFSRFPRERFLPAVYLFFISNLLLFYILFASDLTHEYIARGFFIWVSIYNLFVVSMFWSFLSEIFKNNQARKLFAIIASGGTAGGIFGPLLTTLLIPVLGADKLLLVSALFLGIALFSVTRLHTLHLLEKSQTNIDDPTGTPEHFIRRDILAGVRLIFHSPYLMGISLLILLYATLSTFLYFQQLTIIERAYSDPVQRTTLFSMIEFSANTLALFFQLLLAGKIMARLGTAWTLALIPVLSCLGFIMLWYAPVVGVIVAVQVIKRAGNYAITRPAREMLYVVLSKEEQYKAKNVIDTVIYRGGDMASAWLYTALSAGLGLGLSTIALIAVPLSGLWATVAYRLGIKHQKLASKQTFQETTIAGSSS